MNIETVDITIIGASLKRNTMDRTVTTTIDPNLCNGCGRCISVCPSETITLMGKKAVVSGSESLNCGHCLAACPTEAIRVAALDPRLSSFKTFEPKTAWMPHGTGDIRSLVNLMQSRRSCRNYSGKPISRDILEDLVKIGISAPSATNSQQWTFTILPERSAVLKLARRIGDFFARMNRIAENSCIRKGLRLFGRPELDQYYKDHYETIKEGLLRWEKDGRDLLFHGAPAAIVVGSKKQASCPAEDALLATQNILLGAHAMGLGTCLIGFAIEAMKRNRSIQRKIGMPDDECPYAVVALGYPDEKYHRVTGRKRALIRYFS